MRPQQGLRKRCRFQRPDFAEPGLPGVKDPRARPSNTWTDEMMRTLLKGKKARTCLYKSPSREIR